MEEINIMGTSIDCWIEYDEYNEVPFFDGGGDVLPLSSWSALYGAKDYQIYSAIAGIRSKSKMLPLYKLRGQPENISTIIIDEVHALSNVGWLTYSELMNALEHANVDLKEVSLEFNSVIVLMSFFVEKIGEARVRLIFAIE